MRRNVKKEKQTNKGDASAEPVRTKVAGVARDESANVESNQPNREEDATDRRVLRSKYLAVMTKISDAREEISNADSNKFNIIINEVDNLHQQVSKPREQVADAEALLGLANTLATSVDETGAEEQTDTDRNMAVMFEILRRKRQVKLESFILNRSSFAQTVENLFSLSFLVKDGRVEIVVHGSGSHIVSPKNAPAASSIASGEAAYSHFVFRFDFKDWKIKCLEENTNMMKMFQQSQHSPS
ncbi:non-structural maintenance of chromosomes element 4 homolog A isoform X2 [Gossypium hirsutum]|uniref:Non-structural maintenance of chromosomes element 4 n=1 Tax=Gossypium hirsutum TaxID=3635 RepID=A0ABM2ZTM7_GOSHI|nr:non-structural maintenance of chromosomes element 4 homolog A-like isoform X2 [Gossypium hirsutum]